MKICLCIAGVALLTSCLIENEGYRDMPAEQDLLTPPPDLRPCPNHPAGGGAAADRPEVLVPGGMHQIGEVPFAVGAFYLDVFEVTVGAFRECRSKGGCRSDPGTGPACNWTATAGPTEGHPINCVSWGQADEFCRSVGRGLPTEGEWAYAAGGMGRSTYPWGQEEPGAQLCWKGTGTCPVGGYEKTLLGARSCGGVADLAGNVWEWTATAFNEPFSEKACGAMANACSVRGGSWDSRNAPSVQATRRSSLGPMAADIYTGFRCARPASQ
jgi:formylglycine-generating enzyme